MSIKLKKHNEEAYKKIQENFKTSNKVAVIHPTGTGKSYLALKLLEDNKDKKAIYIAPSNAILHNLKKNIFDSDMNMSDFPNLKRRTYQKLMNLSEEDMEKLDADIIVLDEFHHCGAPEWGSGIDRLLEKNKSAQVLGLSATPIRYFDKSRDMAEELFGNNIASEMSLEEAIETGILPKATYVSALYGLDEELEQIKSDIEKIKDPDKKIKAQKEFENLTKRLDDNTKNLPNLLSKHMENKNGKYIVFCRNIEDMQEKMEQAQAIFGDVNSNITIYAVSSKLKDNEKVLSKFEQDNDEGTLKLMYAVDMLNEGYHIDDLDGVVMMRPTYSPTIYAQQLGRALTVKGKDENEPVIIDLVNNFDSIKIIEDLYDRLKQYKSTGEHTSDNETQSRITIYDTTKEFREIAKRIAELSKRDKITLQEKLEVFERYFKEGNLEIDGQTVFEGYPIGQWGINIRAMLKKDDGSINPTEEQLSKLEDMGILDRQIDSTIDEKIDALVDWSQKYPNARISSNITEDILRGYASTEEEFILLKEQSEKLSRYYDYIKQRNFKNKLTDEQLLKGKEGNIRGIFGYPTKIEELANKYGHSENDIDYIVSKYGDLRSFVNLFRHEGFSEEEIISKYGSMENLEKLRESSDFRLANQILKTTFDIDFSPNSNSYDRLYKAVMGEREEADRILIYSSEGMDKAIETLTPREKAYVEKRYGILDGKIATLEEMGMEFNVTRERARQIEAKCLRRLRHPARANLFDSKLDHLSDDSGYWSYSSLLTDEEKTLIQQLYDSDLLLYNSSYQLSAEKIENPDILRAFEVIKNLPLREKNMDLKKSQGDVETKSKDGDTIKTIGFESDIIELDFSVRTYNVLKRAGIDTLGELVELSEEEIKEIRNLNEKCFEEIKTKVGIHGMSLGMEVDRESIDSKEDEIENLKNIKKGLEEESRVIDGQLEKAEKLLTSYNNIIGENKTNTSDNAPNFDDE